MLKTPLYSLKDFPDVYDPSEDSFLLLDALELEMNFLKSLKPDIIAEIGTGSGIIISAIASLMQHTCVYYATDVNAQACLASLNTSKLNSVNVEILNMNLLNNFKSNLFDVIVFNPPYVVTDSSEIQGNGLNRAWAGGINGRQVTDAVLENLDNLLTDKGVCYMVILKENKPEDIKKDMLNQGFECTVVVDRKVPGEHLFILKFSRNSNCIQCK